MRHFLSGSMCLTAVALTGCLERKVQITSDPPGALVWVNDIEVGRTPVTTGFVYYGDFDVRAHKEGFEPVQTHRDTWSPLYEMPPVDLVTTALPFTLRNTEKWNIELKSLDPALAEPDGLIARAKDLQAQALPPQK